MPRVLVISRVRGVDPSGPISDPLNLPLLSQSGITYLGSFNLPSANNDSSTGLGLGPSGTMFASLNAPWQGANISRLTIPSIGGTASVLASGTVTGSLSQWQLPPATAAMHVTGACYYAPTNRVLASRVGTYSNEDAIANIASCDANLQNWTAPQAVGSPPFPRRGVSGYIARVPAEWQSIVNGDCFIGGGPQSIDSKTSCGPVFMAFNGADVTGSGSVPGTLLLGYIAAVGSTDPTYNAMRNRWLWHETGSVNGAFIIPGTRTCLYFGGEYQPDAQYQQPPNVTDPCLSGSGFHAYPYRLSFWAYDMRDLVAVKNGTMLHYQPRPYGTTTAATEVGFHGWAAPGPLGVWGCNHGNYMSAFFDPATMRFYGNSRWSRQVHVWQISVS